MSFCIGKDRLTNVAKILETNDRGALLELDKEGAGIFPSLSFRLIFYI